MSTEIIVKHDGRTVLHVAGCMIPKGGIFREAYETEKEVVICGFPDPNDASHDCDKMGCSTLNHVLYRFKKEEGA